MKTLIAIVYLLTSWHTFACQISISESYVPTFLNPPVSGHYEKCETPPCHCVDNVNPYTSELVDNIVLDYVAKSQEESCVKAEYSEEFPEANLYQDCDDKFAALVCTSGISINNHDILEVYCATDVMKVDGKKLQESKEKKQAYKDAREAEKQAEKDAKIAAKAAKIKSKDDIKTANSIAKLKDIIQNLIDRLDKLENDE